MGLRIQTNVESLRAQENLRKTHNEMNHTQNKLATGSRIIRALDDAAGLAISENIRASIRATEQNILNAQDAIALFETAEGSLNETTNIVIRMRELSIRAATDTNGDSERALINEEFQALKSELQRISDTTEFNGRYLLNPNLNQDAREEITIQVGSQNRADLDRITLRFVNEVSLDSMELEDLETLSVDSARESLDPLNKALTDIATIRANLGASEARLETTIANLSEYEVNLKSGFSRLRDADIAKETADLTKNKILEQAGISVLAQANQAPALALKLLG